MCALECSRDESPTPNHLRVPPPTEQWLGASVPQPDCCPTQSPAASLSDGPPACMTFPENTEILFTWSCLHPSNQNKLQMEDSSHASYNGHTVEGVCMCVQAVLVLHHGYVPERFTLIKIAHIENMQIKIAQIEHTILI